MTRSASDAERVCPARCPILAAIATLVLCSGCDHTIEGPAVTAVSPRLVSDQTPYSLTLYGKGFTPGMRIRTCVSDRSGGDGCGRSRGAATQRPDDWSKLADPMVAAAEAGPRDRVHLVDLTDAFCDSRWCPAVIGNVLVYADSNHMTPTFARTLVPELRTRLTAALSR